VLNLRRLNRALLARQMLIERRALPAADAVEWLVGMQAQVPNNPYVALWSRLEGFQPDELSRLIAEREAVRGPLLRTTLHLVTARDCVMLRPLVQPLLERVLSGTAFGRGVAGVDIAALLAAGRALLEEQPRTLTELGKALQAQWPERAASDLAYAIHYHLPLVQVPPRGLWGASAQATWTTVEAWLGQALDPDPSPDEMLLRYLAAFGPASVADMRTWSGLSGLREVVARLRPRLRVYRDERGRELLDLPDAPLPDANTPVPPRFLPEYDNVLLSHADRARIVADDVRKRLATANGVGPGTVLIDGFVGATWRIERQRDTATLRIALLNPLPNEDRAAIEEEGARLLAFAAADAGTRDVQVTAPEEREISQA
jgi:hypothetical protein